MTRRIIVTLLYAVLWLTAIVVVSIVIGIIRALLGDAVALILALAVVLGACWIAAGEDEREDPR